MKWYLYVLSEIQRVQFHVSQFLFCFQVLDENLKKSRRQGLMRKPKRSRCMQECLLLNYHSVLFYAMLSFFFITEGGIAWPFFLLCRMCTNKIEEGALLFSNYLCSTPAISNSSQI